MVLVMPQPESMLGCMYRIIVYHSDELYRHQMGMIEAVKLYPYATMWSMLASTCLVME
jgi:hypothetical protein